ncbi:VTT domain-containing protein [Saccharothrix sp. AJ9571]|nr:VTT domain-containing protein [Saccharothrix sp. AJ9571]
MLEFLQAALGSPWLWLLVFAVSALDALLPFMPSETAVVGLAVLVGVDFGALALLALIAAAGAFGGDLLSHGIGRTAGPAVVARLQRGEKGARRYAWAQRKVTERGALLIIGARYLPGGRVAAGLATGTTRYPLRRFVLLDALGASIWAVYSVVLGLFGGAQFSGEPVKGLVLAFGAGLAVVVLLEVARRAVPGRTGKDGQPCHRQNADT